MSRSTDFSIQHSSIQRTCSICAPARLKRQERHDHGAQDHAPGTPLPASGDPE
ncbi:hypothetical protein [Streptomyces sp. NPDC057740]|uniref:hypothetical protein n=1 Tax=Streptomyces sp. NPDC057740 TaxID=3346234 RepID=UPI0036CFD1CF